MSTYEPLQSVIPSYPYQEYADDENVVAFFTAVNTLAQQYLAWFNLDPLAVYSRPAISGPLLDWIAEGIYGLSRPVASSLTTKFIAGLNSLPLNVSAVNGSVYSQSGTATIASDGYFKRVLTWWLYAGNGRHFNVELLRLKVARFIYGPNGTDVTLAQAQTVHIQPQGVPPPPRPTLGGTPGGSLGASLYGACLTYVTPIGETLPGPVATHNVTASHLLTVASPPAGNGDIGYNIYARIVVANPTHFKGALDSVPVNAYALNGNSKRGAGTFKLQNATPIAIGTGWTEPTSGLTAGRVPPTVDTSNRHGNFIISVPTQASSEFFQQVFEQGVLSFPFQFTASVVLT